MIAAAAEAGVDPRYLFVIRPTGRAHVDTVSTPAIPALGGAFQAAHRSRPAQRAGPAKHRHIEKLVIEAALDITATTRLAAELLGLSRQGLYAKLHRFGIGDISGNDQG